MQPLSGIRVLDFSTLLPGPFATLLLAEAGAEVIKVERPESGEGMRRDPPVFAMLNRGKRSIAIDLKQADAREHLMPLLRQVDILVEQFRPGVMERLGLGYEQLSAINPRLIYCSITGYGARGSNAQKPGHDLNYQAEAGVLSLTAGADGAPGMPAMLSADIGGGSYPAIINILLALRQRDISGVGCHIDVAMFDNLFPMMVEVLGAALGHEHWPAPGSEPATGGSARYNVYRTRDGRYLAVACSESGFWSNFCAAIALPDEMADDHKNAAATMAAVAGIIAKRDAAEWESIFAGQDLCCSVVKTLQEALASPGFTDRGLLFRQVTAGQLKIPALPVPLADTFLSPRVAGDAPALGEANESFFGTLFDNDRKI